MGSSSPYSLSGADLVFPVDDATEPPGSEIGSDMLTCLDLYRLNLGDTNSHESIHVTALVPLHGAFYASADTKP